MSKSDYHKLLRDPRWQRVRLTVMERDGFRCLSCGACDSELHIHHLAYHPGAPWDSPLDELETLCHKCHKARTEYDRKMRLMPTSLVVGLQADVARKSLGMTISEDGLSLKLPSGSYDIDWTDLDTVTKIRGWALHLRNKLWFTDDLCREFIYAATSRIK